MVDHVHTTCRAHVHERMDSYSPIIETLPPGTMIDIDELWGTGWVHLIHDGYVLADDVDLDPDDE